MVAIFRAIFLINANGMLLNSFTVLTHAESHYYLRIATVARAFSRFNNFIANTLPTNIYIIRHGNLPIELADLAVARLYPC